MSKTDEQLVSASLAGDRTAFDVLIERHYRKAVAVAARLLGNLDDGLEVAQDSFAKAFAALAQLKNKAQFGSWVMRIVVNNALNYRRNRSRFQTLPLVTSETDNGEANLGGPMPATKEPSAVENLQAQELQQALQEAIDELPEKLRAPLLLFSVEKLPQKEIATMLDMSVAKVKWSVFEARRRLKQRLDKWINLD